MPAFVSRGAGPFPILLLLLAPFPAGAQAPPQAAADAPRLAALVEARHHFEAVVFDGERFPRATSSSRSASRI
jgi:hypothetical protein